MCVCECHIYFQYICIYARWNITVLQFSLSILEQITWGHITAYEEAWRPIQFVKNWTKKGSTEGWVGQGLTEQRLGWLEVRFDHVLMWKGPKGGWIDQELTWQRLSWQGVELTEHDLTGLIWQAWGCTGHRETGWSFKYEERFLVTN